MRAQFLIKMWNEKISDLPLESLNTFALSMYNVST